mmetsp:Transcript_23303/g.35294  ORF Transcript_23303/g.35294 Transcript_23303/m.35294 type:complete len:236 (+) Transcript_23303:937-1644(+)
MLLLPLRRHRRIPPALLPSFVRIPPRGIPHPVPRLFLQPPRILLEILPEILPHFQHDFQHPIQHTIQHTIQHNFLLPTQLPTPQQGNLPPIQPHWSPRRTFPPKHPPRRIFPPSFPPKNQRRTFPRNFRRVPLPVPVSLRPIVCVIHFHPPALYGLVLPIVNPVTGIGSVFIEPLILLLLLIARRRRNFFLVRPIWLGSIRVDHAVATVVVHPSRVPYSNFVPISWKSEFGILPC